MIDCLIIGFNDTNFEEYVNMVRAMGVDSGAFKDLDLAFIELNGKPYTSMDVLNEFYFQGKTEPHQRFHNTDFLWPVVSYLGTFLARRGFSFDYVNLFQFEKEKLREKLQKEDILTIAITTTLYVSAHPILEIISFIRQYNRTAKIIVGGPHISNQTKSIDLTVHQMFKYLGADIYVTCQEGESALVNIIHALKGDGDLDKVDNLAYRKGGRYVITQSSTESNPLEENLVDYMLFPPEEIDQFVSTRTAKSCPFACAFCGFPERAGKYLYLEVDQVEKELNAIRDVGTITTVTFLDDTFNVPKGRFKEMLRMMIRNRYGFKWNCFYRSDHGDEEAIELMGQAGCEGVFLGVESGSDRILQLMNKTARRKDYLKAIPLLRAAGISTYASLIIGFPGEMAETVSETIDFLEESRPDFFRAQLWYADPITPVWEKRDEYKIKGVAFNWSHYSMDSRTACDWIDRIFLSVQNSTWLPQFGFEQWSTFYLQRKGMSLDKIKTFLQCFNAALKEKLLQRGTREISADLLASLQASSRFDTEALPDKRPVEALSGASYVAAERFWVEEFRTSPKESAPTTELAQDEWRSLRSRLSEAALERLPHLQDPQSALLAAFGLLLSRLYGRDDNCILTAAARGNEISAAPLRLRVASNTDFAELTQSVADKLAQGERHKSYAFHLLTNPVRLAQHGCVPQTFDIGFVFHQREGEPVAISLRDAIAPYSRAAASLSLILNVFSRGEGVEVEFSFAASLFDQEDMERTSITFNAILETINQDSHTLAGELAFTNVGASAGQIVETDANEVFNF